MRQLDGTRFDSGHKNVNEMIVASQNNARNDTDFLQWIDSSQLRILNEISQGGFGIVYEAEWFDGLIINTSDDGTIYGNRGSYQHLVAVKFFEQDKDFLKEFTNIYRMIRECSEEDKELSNIIRYYGATYDYDDQEYGIVMQYCPESSLSDYLTYNWQDVDWKKKLQILRDISYGLYTLHNQDLIHGDLHAGNVMIDDDDSLDSEIALLGDLGFCRFEEKTKKVNDVIGVIPYIAPEIFAGAPYSKKADIYSFGIIMYYVSTNVPPFHDRPHDFRLAKEIFDGLRPTVEEEIPTCFETLMRNCWNHDARSRPNAYTLYEKFHKWIDYGEEFEDMEYQVFEPIDESEFHRKAIYTSQTWRSPIINL